MVDDSQGTVIKCRRTVKLQVSGNRNAISTGVACSRLVGLPADEIEVGYLADSILDCQIRMGPPQLSRFDLG